MDYIRSDKSDGCFICDAVARNDDRDHLLAYRGEACCVVINRYPYNSGHVMVAPYRHVASLEEMTDAERLEIMHLTSRSVQALGSIMHPDGFNVGINLGEAAGAGLKDHVHQHVVPRWVGDTNFMPVMADVKVIPQALEELWDALHPLLADKRARSNRKSLTIRSMVSPRAGIDARSRKRLV